MSIQANPWQEDIPMVDDESRYVEIGVESVWPDDDFARWVGLKRAEKEGRRFAERMKIGFQEMQRAECSSAGTGES
jgi:hypothetical protein